MWKLIVSSASGRCLLTQSHDSEDDAQDALTEYVERNWVEEMPDGVGPYYLADDAVQEYFDNVNETYEIAEVVASAG